MFSSVGIPELLLVLLIVLIVLGPKRLPALGKQLGRGFRELRESVGGRDDEKAGLEDRPDPPA